jgi:carboxypeptidase C (cathepsin A)
MESLQWSGQDAYNAAKKHTWVVDGKTGGEYKTAGKLTVSKSRRNPAPPLANIQFLKVFGAGHMVPMDQPERASALLADWLTTGTIGNK